MEEGQKAAEALNAAGDLNYVELSVAAKAYFLLTQKGGPAKTIDLVLMARQFGWSVSETDIRRAVDFLQRLGLAEAKTAA